jgi:GT2 family glycosyltransferase
MSKPQPQLTLCIINFNGAEHLRQAFAALAAQDWEFAEILVVDNASNDESESVVRELCPVASFIRLPENLGPGAARNAGFAAARYDLILFQDNDVRLQPGTVQRLVDCLVGANGGDGRRALAVAPRVLYADDPATVQFDSADCHFLGLMSTRNADLPLGTPPLPPDCPVAAAETTSLVTACFLLDRRYWHGPAPFDETLGFNLEDHDFGVRARVAGYTLWHEPSATVLHGSGTPGLSYRPGRLPSEQRIFYLVRNRWIVIGKCYALRTLLVLAPALLTYELMQLGWLVRHGHGGTWWRALKDVVGQRRRILAARRMVQGRRVSRDATILRDAPLPVTRHVRDRAPSRLLPLAERMLRGYWQLARYWI